MTIWMTIMSGAGWRGRRSACDLALLVSLVSCAPALAQPGVDSTKVQVAVPKEVSARAAARLSGDSTAAPPVLVLDGLELGNNEGLTIRVMGPPESESSKAGAILGVAGMVGRRHNRQAAPLQKTMLVVPLNDRALKLLASHSEITLTLQVRNNPGRPPLKVDRVYFQTMNKQ
jgi:hypothetical protein